MKKAASAKRGCGFFLYTPEANLDDLSVPEADWLLVKRRETYLPRCAIIAGNTNEPQMKKLILFTGSLLLLATTHAQTFAWANKIGSTGADICRDIATDAAGNVYSTGTFTGSADFDPGAGTTTLTSAGGTDIFITKLDAAGALVWAYRIGNASNEEANGIALDATGNIHITGCFYGTVDFDPGVGVSTLGNGAGADIYVLKLNNSAGFVWVKQFGGTSDNQLGNKIAVDAAGNVYSTGQSIGVIDFDPGPGTANLGVAFSGNTNF